MKFDRTVSKPLPNGINNLEMAVTWIPKRPLSGQEGADSCTLNRQRSSEAWCNAGFDKETSGPAEHRWTIELIAYPGDLIWRARRP